MKFRNGYLATIILAAYLLLAPYFVSAEGKVEWSKPQKPFCIAGNLYYVGTYDLACYLITTSEGHILINEALDSTVPMIRTNVEKLGFKFTDIKILFTSQAHFDHVGGLAKIQALTGAKVMIDKMDAPVVEDGGNSDYLFGGKGRGSMFKPVKVDRLLSDGDIVALGGIQLKMMHHPGHTKGACSYLVDIVDKKRTFKVLIANMPTILDDTKAGMATYPNVDKDFAYTLQSLKTLKFDLWVAAHASQFYLHENHKDRKGYHPELFMDKKHYDEELKELSQDYSEKFGR